jgi:hypothetical protein
MCVCSVGGGCVCVVVCVGQDVCVQSHIRVCVHTAVDRQDICTGCAGVCVCVHTLAVEVLCAVGLCVRDDEGHANEVHHHTHRQREPTPRGHVAHAMNVFLRVCTYVR